MKSLLIIMSLTLALGLNAKDYEKEAKKIMEKKVSERKTVICSPDGRDGSLKPAQALGKLRDKGKLVLLPGTYSGEMEIHKKGIVIEGVIGEKINLTLKILGSDCIIRNFWGSYLYLQNDATVINSIFGYVSCYSRNDYQFYNSMLGEVNNSYESDVLIANCTIRNTNSECLDPSYSSDVEVIDSVLHSKSKVFEFYSYGRKQCDLTLKNNLIYGEMSVGSLSKSSTTSSRNSATVAHDFKDLKKICRLKHYSGNKYEPIKFKYSLSSSSSYLEPKHSLLADDVKQGAKFSGEWLGELPKEEIQSVEENTNSEASEAVSGEEELVSFKPEDGFFQYYSISDGMQISSNSVSIDYDRYSFSLKTMKKYLNFELSFDYKFSGEKISTYITLRRDDDAGMKVYFKEDGINCFIHEISTTSNRAGSTTTNIDFQEKKWHNIRIVCKNNFAKVYLNDKEILSKDFKSLTNPGRFKISSYGSSSAKGSKKMYFKNMKFQNFDEEY